MSDACKADYDSHLVWIHLVLIKAEYVIDCEYAYRALIDLAETARLRGGWTKYDGPGLTDVDYQRMHQKWADLAAEQTGRPTAIISPVTGQTLAASSTESVAKGQFATMSIDPAKKAN